MKKRIAILVFVLIFLIGLSLVLYPSVSNYWNKYRQSEVIGEYVSSVSNVAQSRYASLWTAAEEYNADSANRSDPQVQTAEQQRSYASQLDVSGTGVMGYVEIPSIDCTLAIYHGSDEGVLQSGVGHIEWSSLPIGGEGSHCVLSGHRGLPRAKLFSELSEVCVGDIFILRVLDKSLSYEVDQILTVLPEETDALNIVPGEDYCTLVTCTPYGVNTHRLLVRGHRVEDSAISQTVRVTSDGMVIEPLAVAGVLAVPLLIVAFSIVGIFDRIEARRRRNEDF